MHRAYFLAIAVAFAAVPIGCSRHTPPAASEAIELKSIEIGTDAYEYVWAEDVAADIVIIVDVWLPPWNTPETHRFSLKRNPDAPWKGITPASICWRACGGGGGYGGYVRFSGHDEANAAVTMSVSLDWSTRDNRHGEAEGELTIPWLGEARHDIGNGVTVHAQISPAPK